MKAFVSQNGLAKRIGLAENTLAARLRTRGVEPDGIMLRATRPDTLLFDLERINELRGVLRTQKPIEADIQA